VGRCDAGISDCSYYLGTKSTVGRDEVVIRGYLRNHKEEDKRLDPLKLWK
jgi:hypothetical protein